MIACFFNGKASPEEENIGELANIGGLSLFQRLWAVGQLCLIATTYRLWWQSDEFPAVPMRELPGFVFFVDRLTVLLVVGSLAWIASSRRPRRSAFVLVAVGLAFLFIVNQHRMQPWAYQNALYSTAFACFTAQVAHRWIVAVAISVYLYSSLGKFDYQFLHTVGQDFVSIAMGPPSTPPSSPRLGLAAMLPVAELAIAIGLMFRRSRRVAGVTAILMHCSLLGALGPWMLGHSAGVVGWNVLLIVQSWFLFVAPVQPGVIAQQGIKDNEPSPIARRVATAMLVVALLMPITERAGYWDHWLSWSLYSPHTSRVELEVHETSLADLPTAAQPFVMNDDDNDGWQRVSLDQWSLERLGVPIYPQARFQLGLVLSLMGDERAASGIRIKLKSASNRLNGTRDERWLQGAKEISKAANDYWLLPSGRS
jgi:hypothetical protein